MLHGDVKVNDHVIGTWTAVRTRDKAKDNFPNYDCTLEYVDIAGYKWAAQWLLIGQGPGTAGGIGLAARVLTEGMGKAKRVWPETDAEAIFGMRMR